MNKTFSRSRTKSDNRRLSHTPESVTLPLETDVVPFCFEPNPHGNGGLHNAMRSVVSVPPSPQEVHEPSAAASRAVTGTRNTIGNYTWVGTLGCSTNDYDMNLRKEVERRYAQEKRSAVVWVDDQVFEPAYDLYCKQVRPAVLFHTCFSDRLIPAQILWPTFHYQIHDAHKSKAYESPSWTDYRAMNQAFADKIVSIYKPGDLGDLLEQFSVTKLRAN